MAGKPGPHPIPPADFSKWKLPVVQIDTRLFRIHPQNYGAVFYGTGGNNRFDDPEKQFGVLYAGLDEYCAFIETHGQNTGNNVISEPELASRCLTMITPSRRLDLVDLTGAGLAKIGADSRICSADHDVAQAWARAIWSHPSQVDGIRFRARHDPERFAVAIFDRGVAWEQDTLGSLLDPGNADLLAHLLDVYDFALL